MAKFKRAGRFQGASLIARRVTAVFAALLAIAPAGRAQTVQPKQPAQLMGTVTDFRGDAIAGATVRLVASDPSDERTVVAAENGFFEFGDLKPGVAFQVTIQAEGF